MRRAPVGADPQHSFPAMVIPAIARITNVADQFDVARDGAQVVISSSPTKMFTMHADVGLAMIAIIQNDAPAAMGQYRCLEPLRAPSLTYSPFALTASLASCLTPWETWTKRLPISRTH